MNVLPANATSQYLLPDLAPRRQHLLHDPISTYLAGLDEGTKGTVQRSLRRITRLMEAPSVDAVPWENLRYPHYQAIKGELLAYRRDPDDPNSGLAPGTINLTLTHLRGIARQVWSLGYMTAEEWERIKEIKPVSGSRLPAGRAVKGGELHALMDVCARDRSPAGVRDAAMIALLYATGLRRAELAALRIGDYRPEAGELKVLGKGNKERMVYPMGGAAAALADWLVVRGGDPGQLFHPINKGGRIQPGALTEHAVYRMLEKRAKQAGLSEELKPHDLRRSFGTELFRRKTPTSVVQRMMGHASPTTTVRYDRSGEEAEREAAELLHVPYTRRYAEMKGR